MSDTAIVAICMLVAGFGLGAAVMCMVYWYSFLKDPAYWERSMRNRRIQADIERMRQRAPTRAPQPKEGREG